MQITCWLSLEVHPPGWSFRPAWGHWQVLNTSRRPGSGCVCRTSLASTAGGRWIAFWVVAGSSTTAPPLESAVGVGLARHVQHGCRVWSVRMAYGCTLRYWWERQHRQKTHRTQPSVEPNFLPYQTTPSSALSPIHWSQSGTPLPPSILREQPRLRDRHLQNRNLPLPTEERLALGHANLCLTLSPLAFLLTDDNWLPSHVFSSTIFKCVAPPPPPPRSSPLFPLVRWICKDAETTGRLSIPNPAAILLPIHSSRYSFGLFENEKKKDES